MNPSLPIYCLAGMIGFLICACQRQPKISPAASSLALLAQAPMGSSTNNDKLQKKLSALLPRLSPDGPKRQMQLGIFYYEERRFVEAAEALSQVLDAQPNNIKARSMLARCFYFLGNPDRAIAELEYIILHTSPDQTQLLESLFIIGAVILDHPNPSIAQVKKAIVAWESYQKALPNGVGEQQTRVHDGLLQLRTKLETLLHPKPLSRSEMDGERAFQQGDMLTAERQLKEKLQKKREPSVMVLLGRVYLQTGRMPQGGELFNSAVAEFPRFAPGWHYRGMSELMGGRVDEAIRSWETVKKLDSGYFKQFHLDERIAAAQKMLQ